MKSIRYQIASALVAALATATSAHAAWTFQGTGGVSNVGANTSEAGNTDGGVSITQMWGFAAQNGGTLTAGALGTTITAGTTYGASGFASGANWAGGQLQYYGNTNGYGMASDSSTGTVPNHAMDNGPATDANDKISGIGNTEAMFISFSSAIALNSINLGYIFGDADISVFRQVGAGPWTGATSLAGMATSGFQLVGNYANLSQGVNAINTGGATSTQWIISAYNSAWGTGTGLDQGNDFFKILGVGQGTSCTSGTGGCNSAVNAPVGVPEPTSLALVAIAGLGFVGARRRALKASTAA